MAGGYGRVFMIIACLGETLTRFSPQHRRLLVQGGALELHVGGAETNVAIGLSSLGHMTRMIGMLPDNALGQIARATLRGAGVDCRHLGQGPGRMGLYFMTPGAGLRSSDIVYDRADSAFSRMGRDDIDWKSALHGATRLHLSGITPALGPRSAELAIAAVHAARDRGIPISFDCNYREKLWKACNSQPRAILHELVAAADILFGNHRDVALLLDTSFSSDGAARRRDAAEAAFGAYPGLRLIASTARHAIDADRNSITARIDGRDGHAETDAMRIAGIVDRIGAGDAFAVGVLHALAKDSGDLAGMARTGLALAALKHSIPGDASLFGEGDLDAFLSGERDVRR